MGAESPLRELSKVDSLTCRCDPEKIRVVHIYLKQRLSDFVLHDLHAPTRLMAGWISSYPHSNADCISGSVGFAFTLATITFVETL